MTSFRPNFAENVGHSKKERRGSLQVQLRILQSSAAVGPSWVPVLAAEGELRGLSQQVATWGAADRAERTIQTKGGRIPKRIKH